MLKFPDNTQASVFGLDEIMADLFAENEKPTYDTADEIIMRLEEKRNFIPSSMNARREYASVLLQEYRRYMDERSGKVR